MSIWTDPDFQYRVRQLLIYSIEFIETDAECYRESNAVKGQLEGLEQQVYESEMGKVAEIARLLEEIDGDKGGTNAIGV